MSGQKEYGERPRLDVTVTVLKLKSPGALNALPCPIGVHRGGDDRNTRTSALQSPHDRGRQLLRQGSRFRLLRLDIRPLADDTVLPWPWIAPLLPQSVNAPHRR
jgi:hypothetical protein